MRSIRRSCLVYVLVADGSADVRDADDCTSLEVRIAADDSADLSGALAASGLGSWAGGTEVDLVVDGLHALAHSAATTPDWAQRWTAMLSYAAGKGWLSPDGATVRAHVVTDPATA
jgi:hypothetical protein